MTIKLAREKLKTLPKNANAGHLLFGWSVEILADDVRNAIEGKPDDWHVQPTQDGKLLVSECGSGKFTG